MADDQMDQDEIEKLLHEAQRASEATSEVGSAANEDAPPPSPGPGVDSVQPKPVGQPSGQPQTQPAAGAATHDAENPDAVSQEDIELLLNQAEQAIASIETPVDLPSGVQAFQLRDFTGAPATTEGATLELVRDVQLDLKIELGRTRMHLEDVLRLRQGAVVPLDKLAGDPVDLFVNGRLIAKGEVLVLNDNFCVRVTELIVGESACA